MPNALVPEFAVSDWSVSRRFYCDFLGFGVVYERPEEGFSYLRLGDAGYPLYLPLEEKWYRKGETEVGNRQFVVADPDGYLLRFYEDLGTRA